LIDQPSAENFMQHLNFRIKIISQSIDKDRNNISLIK
jgi:hypothetical protein